MIAKSIIVSITSLLVGACSIAAVSAKASEEADASAIAASVGACRGSVADPDGVLERLKERGWEEGSIESRKGRKAETDLQIYGRDNVLLLRNPSRDLGCMFMAKIPASSSVNELREAIDAETGIKGIVNSKGILYRFNADEFALVVPQKDGKSRAIKVIFVAQPNNEEAK